MADFKVGDVVRVKSGGVTAGPVAPTQWRILNDANLMLLATPVPQTSLGYASAPVHLLDPDQVELVEETDA